MTKKCAWNSMWYGDVTLIFIYFQSRIDNAYFWNCLSRHSVRYFSATGTCKILYSWALGILWEFWLRLSSRYWQCLDIFVLLTLWEYIVFEWFLWRENFVITCHQFYDYSVQLRSVDRCRSKQLTYEDGLPLIQCILRVRHMISNSKTVNIVTGL